MLLGRPSASSSHQTSQSFLFKKIQTHLSVAHCISSYPTSSGTPQYKIWPLVRRKVLKMAALKVPASGFWRFCARP